MECRSCQQCVPVGYEPPHHIMIVHHCHQSSASVLLGAACIGSARACKFASQEELSTLMVDPAQGIDCDPVPIAHNLAADGGS